MSGAYIEMLPPDRPIHMIGQPIIKLVASGGPGGDLGDVQQVNWALQQELQFVNEGGAPDVSAEYFRPQDVPGLSVDQEGPHTGRQGVYPKKLRDMVVYDMSGTTHVRPLDIARATPMNTSGGLGCCGADQDEGMSGSFGVPYFDDGMMADAAKALDGRCKNLEIKAKEVAEAVSKANADKSLSASQRNAVAKAATQSLKALKDDWKRCRARLKQIIEQFEKKGNLRQSGLSGVASKLEREETVARCRAKLREITAERKRRAKG